MLANYTVATVPWGDCGWWRKQYLDLVGRDLAEAHKLHSQVMRLIK